MHQRTSLRLALAIAFVTISLVGCGEKDVPAKTELTSEEVKQVEELNQQRTDEWGKKAR
jgi:hypothetical protein